MRAELGTFMLMVGVTASLLGIVVLGRGIATGNERLLRLGRRYTAAILFAVVGGFAVLEWALFAHDYTIKFVEDNVANATPGLFTFTALWSALEGSIMLWALILSIYIMGTSIAFRKRVTDPLVAWATIVQYVVALFFFGLMATVANPFATTGGFTPLDGHGPNPLLQDHPLVAFHPPFLYAGYVGMTIPFSFAIAALVTGRFGEGWLADTRRASLIAWGFLTIGIVLGAWWSYEVLGWGGYWGWDPVENASLLPWLTATAFLHSVMVQERRGMLRVWNLSLIISTFALTILGTFLTRSGVITSVHAFTQSTIGPALLGFFALVIITGLGLIMWRGDLLHAPGRIDAVMSRESAFLANNLLFTGFAFVVFTGTVFPLLVEALQNKQISVGGPYFDTMTTPLGLGLLFLMSIGPILPWRAVSGELLRDRLLLPLYVGALVMVGAVLFSTADVAGVLAYGLGAFCAAGIVRNFFVAVRARKSALKEPVHRSLAGTVRGNPRRWGGLVVHLGVVMIAIALAASQGSATSKSVVLSKGESATVAGNRITYLGSSLSQDAQKATLSSHFAIHEGSDSLGTYSPAISTYPNVTQGIATPSVHVGLVRDVYLSLVAAPDDSGKVTVQVLVNPMVSWLWLGGLVMALGTLLCLVPKKRSASLGLSAAAKRRGAGEPGGDSDDASDAELAPVAGA
jgi:cytochrome c-type biogenesis protein CcmF